MARLPAWLTIGVITACGSRLPNSSGINRRRLSQSSGGGWGGRRIDACVGDAVVWGGTGARRSGHRARWFQDRLQKAGTACLLRWLLPPPGPSGAAAVPELDLDDEIGGEVGWRRFAGGPGRPCCCPSWTRRRGCTAAYRRRRRRGGGTITDSTRRAGCTRCQPRGCATLVPLPAVRGPTVDRRLEKLHDTSGRWPGRAQRRRDCRSSITISGPTPVRRMARQGEGRIEVVVPTDAGHGVETCTWPAAAGVPPGPPRTTR